VTNLIERRLSDAIDAILADRESRAFAIGCGLDDVATSGKSPVAMPTWRWGTPTPR
jgi:hypothetical protein